jgi:hypothetical protein
MTIAQQLNITEFPFAINNSAGQEIYWEKSAGEWFKREYDANGNQTRFEISDGYWSKWEYDAAGQEIYWEISDGYWCKREYDADGNLVYWETPDGIELDNRAKTVELTLDEIAAKFGIPVESLKIKK